MKPILFNTDMVKAILDGRKSCTRRIVKPQQLVGSLPDKCKNGVPEEFLKEKKFMFKPYCDMTDIELIMTSYKKPYQPGDILYVRETWEHFECCCCEGDEHGNCYREPQQSVLNKSCGCYMYRATDEIYGDAKWHPSIHMPKEAARIWLKVTDVRVERLQEITEDEAVKEGVYQSNCKECNAPFGCDACPDEGYNEIDGFADLWNSTIKKSDLDRYGWDANPWVWVIEFERCDKPESEGI
jgi:hypothetical protein